MLAAAGFPNGFDATVVISNTSPEQQRTAILLQNSFKQIGVNLSIDSQPFAKYTSITQQHSFPNFALWNINSLVIDYGYHASLFLNQGQPPNFNYGSWKQQEFGGLLPKVASMAPTDRKAATQRMQQIFNQELPYIPLATIAQCTAFQNGVSGYVWHTTNQVFFADLKMS
jgi:peptide/nickel transport system substrate-binding protein